MERRCSDSGHSVPKIPEVRQGIAVRVPGGFMFYASGNQFRNLDGRVFKKARAIERELRRNARREASKLSHFQRQPGFA